MEGGKPENPEKNPRNRNENQLQMVGAWNTELTYLSMAIDGKALRDQICMLKLLFGGRFNAIKRKMVRASINIPLGGILR